MKNLGFPDKFVGITVKKLETGGISLDLENYINETIKVFGMQNANEADTPLAADTVLESYSSYMETPSTGDPTNKTPSHSHPPKPNLWHSRMLQKKRNTLICY